MIRLLPKAAAAAFSVERLGFQLINYNKFMSALRAACGIILITGPTGSGKTTTLYAALNELNMVGKNIVTVEDPVEYMLDGINQTQVNLKAGMMTFAAGLRSILRQDPDVIMVGEIRDAETARIAVRAAATGHLVLSTLHTRDAAGAVTRLIDMGIEPYVVASSLLAVLAQRLVRVICPACRSSYEPPAGSPEWVFLKASPAEKLSLYSGRTDCEKCRNTGYQGRMAVCEVLPITAALRQSICTGVTAVKIKESAVNEGMVPLLDDALTRVREGRTTFDEVMRVAYSGDLL